MSEAKQIRFLMEAINVEEEQLDEGMFQRRQYQFVADVIKDRLGGNRTVADAFSDAFAAEYENFKPDLFLKASGA